MRHVVPKPSPSMVVASLALLVALSGVGIAATILPANSVGTRQLKNNAVNSAKVKDGSLLAADFKAGQLSAGPAGPAGAKGDKGDKGDPGKAATKLWALVNADGTVAQGSGVVSVSHQSNSFYFVKFAQDITHCAPVVSIGSESPAEYAFFVANASTAIKESVPDTVAVLAILNNVPGNAPFALAVFC